MGTFPIASFLIVLPQASFRQKVIPIRSSGRTLLQIRAQWPQDEQFDEEHDEQLELLPTPALPEVPELNDAYLPRPKADIILLVFLDLHLGHTATTFSSMPKVSISNWFLHLLHLYS
jgi:hypothetical protein